MITVLAISLMPISISAPTYITCQTNVWFNSAPDGRDGPMRFLDVSTFTELNWSNQTYSPSENHRFTNFLQCQRGSSWYEPLLGLNIDDNANATLDHVGRWLIKITINMTGVGQAENYIYLPNRPNATQVSFSNAGVWAWNATSRVFQFNTTHASINIVIFRWAPTTANPTNVSFTFSTWFDAYALTGVLVISCVGALILMFQRGVGDLKTAMLVVALTIGLIIVLAIFSNLIGSIQQGGVNVV